MRTAIVYTSRHGTTEKIARLIAEKLADHDITIFDLRVTPSPMVEDFDRIIIGGSIHIGQIQNRVKRFCEKNMDLLLQKDIGLFMCGMQEEKLKEEFDMAYPKRLRDHSRSNGIFGGEILFDRLNFLEKMIVKVMAHQHETISKIDFPAIDRFIDEMETNLKLKI